MRNAFKSCLGTPWALRYDHICKNIIFQRSFPLSASKMTYFRVISVEHELSWGYHRRRWLLFGLSASHITYFRVISVEDDLFLDISVDDDLFLGYQRRRWFIFRLSVSNKNYFQAISVEDALFLGYQRRRWFGFCLSASKMTYVWIIRVNVNHFYVILGPSKLAWKPACRTEMIYQSIIAYMMGLFWELIL